MHVAIPYQITKFKSANTCTGDVGPTAKFKSHQYFWLYGMYTPAGCMQCICIVGTADGFGYDGQQKYNICDTYRPYQLILSH